MDATCWGRGPSMTEDDRFTQLSELILRIRAEHPGWFRLRGEGLATPEQIVDCEVALGCVLPTSYRRFVAEVGSGDFAFTSIYSPNPASDVWIGSMNQLPWVQRPSFVAFADNGSGDYYGWRIQDRVAVDEVVLLDHNTGDLRSCDLVDFVDFVQREGLRQ